MGPGSCTAMYRDKWALVWSLPVGGLDILLWHMNIIPIDVIGTVNDRIMSHLAKKKNLGYYNHLEAKYNT